MPVNFSFHGALLESLAVLVMLGILSILIIVHECGHYSVARLFGFQTPVFGFGLPFGPHLVVGRKWNTEFRIYAFLMGGFVAIPELGDESNQDAFGMPLAPFRKFPIWQRALVASAGVAFNVLFAYLIMLVMFFSLGQPAQSTVVYELMKDNPIAAQAGIKVGDVILSVDHDQIVSPSDAVKHLSVHKNEAVTIDLERDGKPLEIKLTTNPLGKVGMALIPKGPVVYQKIEGNFFQIAGAAALKLGSLAASMVDALGQTAESLGQGLVGIFAGKNPAAAGHSGMGWQDLHGVLAVIKIGADVAQQDWCQLFLFTVLISLDLAIINILPYPPLDGVHLAFMTLEAIRGRPMEERAQGEIVKWGFASLMILMAVIMVNDVNALLRGKLDLKGSKDEAQHDVSPPAGTSKTMNPGKFDAGSSTEIRSNAVPSVH